MTFLLTLIAPPLPPMDRTSSPQHRHITPPPPILVPRDNFARFRALFTSSSCDETTSPIQRRPSVRFQGVDNDQLDGSPSDDVEKTPKRASRESRSSRSQRLSDRIESLGAKLGASNGTQTIVHRTGMHCRPTLPQIDPKVETTPEPAVADDTATPSTNSSYTPPSHKADWSPADTVSTAATSWTSPLSSRSGVGSMHNRRSPEELQHISKSISAGVEEGALPPIQEDSGRMLMIPVQEVPVQALPSIVTVERVAAAKVYFETHFHKLLLEPSSARSMRLKRFEQRMADLGYCHDQRNHARRLWNQAETDHLRQMRVLKSSSLMRHDVKGVSIAGFDVVRVLGKGSFGVVRLVTERSSEKIAANGIHKQTNGIQSNPDVSNVDGTAKHTLPTGRPLSDVFAMKVIRKSEMLRACQEGHLRAERDFLVGAEGSRWVVPLIASFQDNTNLYLVMEYMIGGDFLGLLLREDVLDEQVAR